MAIHCNTDIQMHGQTLPICKKKLTLKHTLKIYQTSPAGDWFSQVRTWAGSLCKASKVLHQLCTDLTAFPGLWDEYALVIIFSNFLQLSWLSSLSSPQSDSVPCADSSRNQSYAARMDRQENRRNVLRKEGKKTDFSSFPRDEHRGRTRDNYAWAVSISHNCNTRLDYFFILMIFLDKHTQRQ